MKIKLNKGDQKAVRSALDWIGVTTELIRRGVPLTNDLAYALDLAREVVSEKIFGARASEMQQVVSDYVERGDVIAAENAKTLTSELAKGWLGEASRHGKIPYLRNKDIEVSFGSNWEPWQPTNP